MLTSVEGFQSFLLGVLLLLLLLLLSVVLRVFALLKSLKTPAAFILSWLLLLLTGWQQRENYGVRDEGSQTTTHKRIGCAVVARPLCKRCVDGDKNRFPEMIGSVPVVLPGTQANQQG